MEAFDFTCPYCGEFVQCSAYNMGAECKYEEQKRKEYELWKEKNS
jgi:hypothetical protein